MEVLSHFVFEIKVLMGLMIHWLNGWVVFAFEVE